MQMETLKPIEIITADLKSSACFSSCIGDILIRNVTIIAVQINTDLIKFFIWRIFENIISPEPFTIR